MKRRLHGKGRAHTEYTEGINMKKKYASQQSHYYISLFILTNYTTFTRHYGEDPFKKISNWFSFKVSLRLVN